MYASPPPPYFVFLFVFTSIPLKASHAGGSHDYFNPWKGTNFICGISLSCWTHLLSMVGNRFSLKCTNKIWMRSKCSYLCKEWPWQPHGEADSDHVKTEQSWGWGEGEESKGLPREWSLGSWRSIAEAATINLKGGGSSRSNGTQTLCLWQVRTKNSKNASSRKTFRKLCSHWLRGPWKRMVFTNTQK